MEYSDLSFDYDMNSDFIIIQSCLRDEKHNELIQNMENILLLDDHLTFNLGDSFDSFEALRARLEAHSKHSNVHYWMRDTRTVEGARMKTARKIEERLKYYNVKFVCVYGGGYTLRGRGVRNTSTVKLNCPAHVTLLANRTGERLDVVSVCNHHNHDISPDISRQMRQGRKLTGELKDEVCDLLRMGVPKRRALEFIELRCGKQLKYKDIINMAAAVKGTPRPTQERKEHLLHIMTELEGEFGKSSSANTERWFNSEVKKKRRKSVKKRISARKKKKTQFEGMMEEQSAEMVPDPADEVIVNDCIDGPSDDSSQQIDPDNAQHIHDSNIMEYLLPAEYTEPVLTIMNTDSELVTLPSEEELGTQVEANSNLIQEKIESLTKEERIEENESDLANSLVLKDDMIHFVNNENVEFDSHHVFKVANEENDNYLQYLDHIVIEDKHLMNEETDFENLSVEVDKVDVIPPSEMHILSNDEVVLEEVWAHEDSINDIVTDTIEQINVFEKCINCEKIKNDLNDEINVLKEEKSLLIEETEELRKEKEKLVNDIILLKRKDSIVEPREMPAVHRVRPFKIRNKIYLLKI